MVARVGYNNLISNKREWNNCFIKNAHKISRILPDFICKNNRVLVLILSRRVQLPYLEIMISKSNRPHWDVGRTLEKLVNASFSRVVPTSRVGYHAGILIKSAVYCLNIHIIYQARAR